MERARNVCIPRRQAAFASICPALRLAIVCVCNGHLGQARGCNMEASSGVACLRHISHSTSDFDRRHFAIDWKCVQFNDVVILLELRCVVLGIVHLADRRGAVQIHDLINKCDCFLAPFSALPGCELIPSITPISTNGGAPHPKCRQEFQVNFVAAIAIVLHFAKHRKSKQERAGASGALVSLFEAMGWAPQDVERLLAVALRERGA